MQQTVSKSQFKAHALELFRMVEQQKQVVVVTHAGKPVAKVIPYKEEEKDPEAILKSLRGTLKFYKDPDEPAIEPDDWEALK